jgi:hypothetical protein
VCRPSGAHANSSRQPTLSGLASSRLRVGLLLRAFGALSMQPNCCQHPSAQIDRDCLSRAHFLNQEFCFGFLGRGAVHKLLRRFQRVQPRHRNPVHHLAPAFRHLYYQISFQSFPLVAQAEGGSAPPSPVTGKFRRTYFLSSTSTYSASITPSSFFSPAPFGGAPACGPAPAAPSGCACADLYITSASL